MEKRRLEAIISKTKGDEKTSGLIRDVLAAVIEYVSSVYLYGDCASY